MKTQLATLIVYVQVHLTFFYATLRAHDTDTPNEFPQGILKYFNVFVT